MSKQWNFESLILVRHGECSGNQIMNAANKGANIRNPAFFKMDSKDWPLTDIGHMQMSINGPWIGNNIGKEFEQYLVSSYLRAQESSEDLDISNSWQTVDDLRERHYGCNYEKLTAQERRLKYPKYDQDFQNLGLDWTPPKGESGHQMVARILPIIRDLEDNGVRKVIIVSHGHTMFIIRYIIENMDNESYSNLINCINPNDFLNNGQIIQYSSIDPDTNYDSGHLLWVRSVCPWKEEFQPWRQF